MVGPALFDPSLTPAPGMEWARWASFCNSARVEFWADVRDVSTLGGAGLAQRMPTHLSSALGPTCGANPRAVL